MDKKERIHLVKLNSLDDLLLCYSNHIFKYKIKEGVLYYGIVFSFDATSILFYISKSDIERKWYKLSRQGKIEFLDEYKLEALPIIEVSRDSIIDKNLHRILGK